MKLFNNEYIPIPDYIIQSEEYKIKRVDTKIPDNILMIDVSNLSYSKSNPLMIIINLKSENEIIRTKKIKVKQKMI